MLPTAPHPFRPPPGCRLLPPRTARSTRTRRRPTSLLKRQPTLAELKEAAIPGDEIVLHPPTQGGFIGAVRRLFFYLVTWPPFDYAILLVIISSCVVMATQSPLDEIAGTQPPIYDTLEMLFTYIFTVEVGLKLLGLGTTQYFSQGWNVFDCVVVGSAWLRVLLPDAGNLTVLRAVRVLRALRMVNRVKSLKRIIATLFIALPELSNVAIMFGGFIFIFGILGVNLFEGKMHFRCTEKGMSEPIHDDALCVTDDDCAGSQTCIYYDAGPKFGALSYDNVIGAWATIFQVSRRSITRTHTLTPPCLFYSHLFSLFLPGGDVRRLGRSNVHVREDGRYSISCRLLHPRRHHRLQLPRQPLPRRLVRRVLCAAGEAA